MLQLENGDYIEIDKWHLLIGHPPCTFLSGVGESWFNIDKYFLNAATRWENRFEAVLFFFKMYKIGKKIGKVCLENPKGYINSILKPTQNIHPYYFGDSDLKFTCLWLYGLPKLFHSKGDIFSERSHVEKPKPIAIGVNNGKNYYFTDMKHGSKDRSKTFQGIAKAMAEQWG